MIDARTAFENRHPSRVECLAAHFRHLDPDAREEAVQNATVLAYRYWLRLVEVGKTSEDCFKVGGLLGSNSHEAGSPGRRKRRQG